MNEAHARVLRYFEYAHLPPALGEISRDFHDLAHRLAASEHADPAELTVALRKLLEAKDAAVRAMLRDEATAGERQQVDEDAVLALVTPPDEEAARAIVEAGGIAVGWAPGGGGGGLFRVDPVDHLQGLGRTGAIAARIRRERRPGTA